MKKVIAIVCLVASAYVHGQVGIGADLGITSSNSSSPTTKAFVFPFLGVLCQYRFNDMVALRTDITGRAVGYKSQYVEDFRVLLGNRSTVNLDLGKGAKIIELETGIGSYWTAWTETKSKKNKLYAEFILGVGAGYSFKKTEFTARWNIGAGEYTSNYFGIQVIRQLKK
jgi:hypothetical protein